MSLSAVTVAPGGRAEAGGQEVGGNLGAADGHAQQQADDDDDGDTVLAEQRGDSKGEDADRGGQQHEDATLGGQRAGEHLDPDPGDQGGDDTEQHREGQYLQQLLPDRQVTAGGEAGLPEQEGAEGHAEDQVENRHAVGVGGRAGPQRCR